MPASPDSQPSPSLPTAPHLGPIQDGRGPGRSRFSPAELAVVLSHYDLGVIERVREFRRGSRRSPKVRIVSERGEFLLKRRAPGRDDPSRVAFAHEIQLHLAASRYPVAPLVPTRSEGASMLRLEPHTYELFAFVRGRRDDGTPAAAEEAGRLLGTLHRRLADHRSSHPTPSGTFHGSEGLEGALRRIPPMIGAVEPDVAEADVRALCTQLGEAYREAATATDEAGFPDWRPRIIHGDWHPGNLLFVRGRVAAVLDFDSARREPRVIDVANGALQFSMAATDPAAPDRWPDQLDVQRLRALVRGYDRTAGEPLTRDERRAIPWLVVEALVLESVAPIAATGRFARVSGWEFLRMVERKIGWIRPRATKLAAFLEGT